MNKKKLITILIILCSSFLLAAKTYRLFDKKQITLDSNGNMYTYYCFKSLNDYYKSFEDLMYDDFDVNINDNQVRNYIENGWTVNDDGLDKNIKEIMSANKYIITFSCIAPNYYIMNYYKNNHYYFKSWSYKDKPVTNFYIWN